MRRNYRLAASLVLFSFLAQWAAMAVLGGQAADFPKKNIELLVGYAPGGGTDIAARLVAGYFEKQLGQTVQVINKAGAGGELTYTAVATAKPDGYTIGILNAPTFMSIPLSRQTKYTIDDYQLIGNIVYQENLLVANAGSKFATIDDLIKEAKANPGTITLGHSGLYADDHLASLAFQNAVGIKLEDTSFQGTAPSLVALMGDHIDVVACNTADIIAKYQEKQIVILASMGETRNPLYPEVPTLKEMGYGAVMGTYMTIGVSKNTPDAVVNILREKLKAACNDPAYIATAKASDIPIAYFTHEEMAERFKAMEEMLQKLWVVLKLPKA